MCKSTYSDALLEVQSVINECPKIIECPDCVFNDIRSGVPEWKRKMHVKYIQKDSLLWLYNKHMKCLNFRDEEDYV